MGTMFVLFGAYFLYDGMVGYPKEQGIASRKEWFDKEFLTTFDEAKKEGTLEQWTADAKAKGLPTGTDGEPPKWVSYAALHGWPESPHNFSQHEIDVQFYCAYGCFFGFLIVGVIVLLRKNTVLRAEADHLVTPGGVKVAFADVFRVDKRKWDKQALAYAWYKPGGEGKETRAVIDDLMYDGAGKVLDRLLSRFNGELIEKLALEEPEAPKSPPSESSPDKPAAEA